MIGELQLVFTVRDQGVGENWGVVHTSKYIVAMVKLLHWHQQRSVNPVHGMVKFKPWPIIIERNPQYLIEKRIYFLAHIIRRVNMILATLLHVQYWFVNNYINWDQFNTFYDKNFEKKETYATNKIIYQFT